MKKYILLLTVFTCPLFGLAQLADAYIMKAYSGSDDELFIITAIHLPSDDYELGVLTLNTQVYKGETVDGPKLVDLFYVYNIEAYERGRRDYYYTLRHDYNLNDSEEYTETVTPDPNSIYNYLPVDFITSPSIQFDEDEMVIDLKISEFNLTLKAVDLEIGYDELKGVEKPERTDINEAEKLIVSEESMHYRYVEIDEATDLAYEIYVRVQEQSSDEGVFDVFGRYYVSKVKKGIIQKESGADYFDYQVNSIDFKSGSKDTIVIDGTINNYDDEKSSKLKEPEVFQKRVKALKENTQWILTQENLQFTDKNGNTYIFERLEN